MPGHAGSPYWAAVDFDSEEEHQDAPNHRVYLDPWDNEAYGIIQDNTESSQGENFNSFVGEPVSASFYYVPTKNYDSEEEVPAPRRNITPPEQIIPCDYAVYGRKMSRVIMPEIPIYNEKPMRDRRRSMYIEEPMYAHEPMMYEPLYGHMLPPPPPPGYCVPPPPGFCVPPPPRSRMSLPHHPEYVMANLGYGKHRRYSRLPDGYEHFPIETSPEYEDWARPFPKTAPDNFHLSRYGHLQIDYSCSWNSLDRFIRNQ